MYPAMRKGPKGSGQFSRITWDKALRLIVSRMLEIRERWGAEAILPFYYGGSNGLLSQDTTDAQLFRRFGASRLARTVCAAPTGATELDMLLHVMDTLPGTVQQQIRDDGQAEPPCGFRPVQFVDVFPLSDFAGGACFNDARVEVAIADRLSSTA